MQRPGDATVRAHPDMNIARALPGIHRFYPLFTGSRPPTAALNIAEPTVSRPFNGNEQRNRQSEPRIQVSGIGPINLSLIDVRFGTCWFSLRKNGRSLRRCI